MNNEFILKAFSYLWLCENSKSCLPWQNRISGNQGFVAILHLMIHHSVLRLNSSPNISNINLIPRNIFLKLPGKKLGNFSKKVFELHNGPRALPLEHMERRLRQRTCVTNQEASAGL